MLIGADLQEKKCVSDLKIVLPIWEGQRNDWPGGYCEYRQDLVYSDNGVSAVEYVLSHSQPISGRLSSQDVPMLRAIAGNGLCSDDISGKPSGYRSMPDSPNAETVSHGDIKRSQSLNLSRCKRSARLADICRTRPATDSTGAETICRRVTGRRAEGYRLCTGFNDYRSMSVDVSVGEFSHCQSSSKTAHASGHQGSNPELHPYFRRQAARRKHSGHAYSGTGSILCYGSGISGLPASLHIASDRELLCDKSEEQSECTQIVLGSGRSEYWVSVRSVYCPERSLQQTILSGTIEAYPVQSAGNRQDVGLSEQSQDIASFDHMRFVQKPVGSRAVLSMDKTEPSYQEFLRNIGECSKDANLNCRFGIRADSNCQKAFESGTAALHFSTDSVGCGFREDALAASLCGCRLQYEH